MHHVLSLGIKLADLPESCLQSGGEHLLSSLHVLQGLRGINVRIGLYKQRSDAYGGGMQGVQAHTALENRSLSHEFS